MEHIIKVGIVEDQYMFRVSISQILNSFRDIEMVFESPDGFSIDERLSTADSSTIPDVMLIDLSLPKHNNVEYNGFFVLRYILENYPEMKCLILSVSDDEYLISKLIEEGANGYITKDCHPEDLYNAIVSVYRTGVYINSKTLNAIQGKLAGTIQKPRELEGISPRELDVLRLICQQLTTDEIAEKLFISPKTVNGHRNNLFQKTGSKNMIGLVMYAVKNGLVEVG